MVTHPFFFQTKKVTKYIYSSSFVQIYLRCWHTTTVYVFVSCFSALQTYLYVLIHYLSKAVVSSYFAKKKKNAYIEICFKTALEE